MTESDRDMEGQVLARSVVGSTADRRTLDLCKEQLQVSVKKPGPNKNDLRISRSDEIFRVPEGADPFYAVVILDITTTGFSSITKKN